MLDRGTKIYAAVLAAIVLAFAAAVLYEPPKLRDLNRVLAADPQLAAYPYPFRVLRVDGGTAVLGSPRSAEVPVRRVLGVLEPAVAGLADEDPAYLAAQQRLADTQDHARERVLADPAINTVRWELDADWLRAQGIPLP